MSKAIDPSALHRRTVLRALGYGTAGVGLGFLSACSSSDGAKGATATTAGATTSTIAPTPYDPKTPYWLQGNFAPVMKETTAEKLTVTGSIPKELSGLFVRNGSNPPSGTSAHWFLGDGMLHGVRLENGAATWYRNRYIETPIHKANKDLMDFGGIPGKENSQSNVAMVHHGGKLLATGEVGWPYEIDATDLSTVGAWGYDGKLGDNMTAHPKIDPATGKMHFFGYGILSPGISYYVADTTGAIETVAQIPMDDVLMVHDFAITEKEAVFWIGPVLFGADPESPNPSVPFHWDPSGPSKVGILPLDGDVSKMRWVDIDPFYVFHGMNASRDGDDVVLHLHQLPEAFSRKGDLLPSHLTQWRIGTGGTDLTFASERVSERSMDLPTHDNRFTGRASRHGWCATTTPETATYGFELAGICHIDTTTGVEDVWEPTEHLRGGEGVFVPASDDAAEGEGWVLTYVWNRGTGLSNLAVFDAQEMAKGPIAEVELPARVPFGFHGLWVPDDQI
jgi:carotenoid cleavage dioxygenase